MAPMLSVADIRGLGFDWPKYALVEQYCVTQDGKVDLATTTEKLQSSRFDDYAQMERELGEAIAYLEKIVAASEP